MTPLASVQAYAEAASTTGALSVSVVDAIMYVLIAFLVIAVVWISNRHIKLSREQTQKSEELIEAERTLFERRIAERTKALIRAEQERHTELERNALFGELSRGLFHDLMSPLSALTIYAERMNERSDLSESARNMISKMTATSKRLNSYMESVRRSIGSEKTIADKSILEREIGIVRDILGYKARLADVEMAVEQAHSITLPIHPVRLHQLLLNLVSNAIESCVEHRATQHADTPRDYRVTISAKKTADSIIISVSDNGTGISTENQKRMFKESFTTKEKGTGLGLATVQSVVEKDLKGAITVESEEGRGARFVITIPTRK